MSSSLMSDSSPASTRATSKRHSLLISTGPRPLRLVDGSNSPTPQGPSTAPLSSGFDLSSPCPPSSSRSTPPISGRPLSRRQSSISYVSGDVPSRTPFSPRSRQSLLFSPKSGSNNSSPREEINAIMDEPSPEKTPMTIAEQHADLLRSIAQKEETCLELRSQLASREAELVQLKRKWERIMNRGLPLDYTSSPTLNGSGTVLDGIKEGVQGVSRLVAGFALGDGSPSTQPNALPMQNLRSSPRPTHSSSNSSISTYATKSTRFSQSSASSIGEDISTSPPPVMVASQLSSNGSSTESSNEDNVLIVHDTGATPVMSPNPAFIAKQQRRDERRQRASVQQSPNGFGAELRRRSGDGNKPPSPSPLSVTPESDTESKSLGLLDDDIVDQKKRRRSSAVTASFPPIASMPGLSSLMAGTNAQPVSSWMGKKLEELQKGSTFSKGQKRASLLLSDVSQSIASVLTPSPLSGSPSPSGRPPLPSYFSPVSTPPLTACSTTSSSLLDEDTDDLAVGGFMKASPVMVPEIKPSFTRKDHAVKSSPSHKPPSINTAQKQDDEEEWNW